MKLSAKVEREIMPQFERVFDATDAPLFKEMADYYFECAARLKKADIKITNDLKLLARNCQKRMFIGVGTELLLKAIYLKHGFSINRIASGQSTPPAFPFRFQQLSGLKQVAAQTYMVDRLVDKLHVVLPAADLRRTSRGLLIARVFRNKEAHVVVPKQVFVSANYRDIEVALVDLYLCAFDQILDVRFSLEPNEKAFWTIRKVPKRGETRAL